MNSKRPLLPLKQPRTTPIAPPVYRPQPNPVWVQRKTTTSAQPRTTPSAPPVYRPKSAIQPTQMPKAPPVYKPTPAKVGPLKPPAPKVFSPAPPRHLAVQSKARNGAAIVALAPNATARIPVPRPTTFARLGAIQLLRMRDIPQQRYCVRRPAGEDQARAYEECWALLGRRANDDVGDNLRDARLNVASILLELVGGRDTNHTKIFAYLLGLRQSAPAAVGGGMGTLRLDADGMVEGRPGLLSAAFDPDERVAPGHARRHKTAWHNIKALLNAIQVTYGVGALGRVFDEIHGVVPAGTRHQADTYLQKVPATGATQEGRKVLWLAIVLNSAPDNLWLGSATENVSINTGASVLRRWTRDLDLGEITLADYQARVEGYRPGSPKSRHAREQILHIIRQAASLDAAEQAGHVVQMVFERVMTMLEIDLPNEEAMQQHHLEIFKIAQGIGDLADHANIIRQLMGLEPAAAAAAAGGV